MHLVTDKISLRGLSTVDKEYFNMINDPEIVNYFGISKTYALSEKALQGWLDAVNKNPDIRFFGIYFFEDLVGTCRIDINWLYRTGVISLMLDKDCQGRGIGTRVIELLTDFAFNTLNLHRCEAGILDGNIASYKAFLKAGYIEEGRQKERRFINGKYVDSIMMGKVCLQNV